MPLLLTDKHNNRLLQALKTFLFYIANKENVISNKIVVGDKTTSPSYLKIIM